MRGLRDKPVLMELKIKKNNFKQFLGAAKAVVL